MSVLPPPMGLATGASLEYYRFERSFIIWHDKITLVGIGIIAYRNAERMDVRPSPVEILMTK